MQARSVSQFRTMCWALVASGTGLALAPHLLGFDANQSATWSSWTCAAGFFVTAAVRQNESWFTGLLMLAGFGTLMAPTIVGFGPSSASAFWVHVLAGAVALGCAWQLSGDGTAESDQESSKVGRLSGQATGSLKQSG